MSEYTEKIVKVLSAKGWGLFRRSGNIEATLKGGAAKDLEDGVIYELHPEVLSGKSRGEVEQFFQRHRPNMPAITVRGAMLGRVVAQFGDGHEDDTDERFIHSGETFQFQGIELLREEIRLICDTRAYLTYPAFSKALETLQDIKALLVA
ncbi:MAG: hypothetical protein Q7R48_01870 [bacterium]|nr:hypothetical protein [bacterium]